LADEQTPTPDDRQRPHDAPRSPFVAEIVEPIPRATIVHHVDDDGTTYLSHHRDVFRLRNGVRELIARFPFVMPRDLVGCCRLGARAARADKCNVWPSSSGRILGIRARTVFSLTAGHAEPLFQIQGDSVLHRGLCNDDEGWTYFGEYFMNPQRVPVRIWRVASDHRRWEVAHEFAAGYTRHVHTVTVDPFEPGVMWAAVGDYAGECYLLRTQDRFKTVTAVGDGQQIWRAVTLYFTESHVAWVTDSHLEQNHACRMDRKSGNLEIGQPIEASVWYGTTTTDGLYVALTTVERGPAIQTDQASVLVSDDAFHWYPVLRFKKDGYRPVRLFKFGVLACPSGAMRSSNVVIFGEALRGLDGRSIRVRIDRTPAKP
jgi:hypothetical protein